MSSKITLKNNLQTELTISHRDGTGAKTIYSDELVISVDTIADMEAITAGVLDASYDGTTVIVKNDGGRNGTFVYSNAEVANDNQGTNFNGWVRQYSGAVNVKWFGAVGDGVTDDTVAIQAAINSQVISGVSTKEIDLGANDYVISTALILYPATVFRGRGKWATSITAKSTLTGTMITDSGNAAKIIIEGLELNGSAASGCTSLINMGKTIPLGTEGFFDDIFLRGGMVSSGTNPIGLDIIGNVFFISRVSGIYCSTTFKEGTNTTFVSYDRCVSLGAYTNDYYLNTGAKLLHCEIEAPANSCVSIYVSRSAEVRALTYSQASGNANTSAIELDSGALSFSLEGFYRNTTTATLTNIVKDNRAGKSNYTLQSTTKYLSYSEEVMLNSPSLYINNKKIQAFQILLTKTAGVLYHSINAIGAQGTVSPYVTEITGATVSTTATPLGDNATTAFAGGAKINSAATYQLLLNNKASLANTAYICSIHSASIALTVNANISLSINVNGATDFWTALNFYTAATGAVFSPSSLTDGQYIRVAVLGIL